MSEKGKDKLIRDEILHFMKAPRVEDIFLQTSKPDSELYKKFTYEVLANFVVSNNESYAKYLWDKTKLPIGNETIDDWIYPEDTADLVVLAEIADSNMRENYKVLKLKMPILKSDCQFEDLEDPEKSELAKQCIINELPNTFEAGLILEFANQMVNSIKQDKGKELEFIFDSTIDRIKKEGTESSIKKGEEVMRRRGIKRG